MLHYPQIDPVAVQLGPLAIHWYGLTYLVAFALAWGLGRYRIAQGRACFNTKEFEDFLFYAILGVVLGGRLGYVLFYQPSHYLANPLEIFYFWQGGMSFHGGLLGVIAVMFWFAHRTGRRFLEVADFVAPLVPLGLASGRIGNFINAELWGRVTDVPWAMVFPTDPQGLLRHPSQLYQFALEGVLLFIVVWWFSSRPRLVGQVGGVFLAGYGLMRFLAEFAREPDSYLGLLLGHTFSMGQLLSIPMILIGTYLFFRAKAQH